MDSAAAKLSSDGTRASGLQPIRVLFCCDPPYHQHLAAAVVSLLESNRNNLLEIHLITEHRDADSEARLLASWRRYENFAFQIHEFTWPEKRTWHTTGWLTAEAYTRIFSPLVLDASIDRILYLDADLVVVDDLAPLWNTDLEGFALAAAAEPFGAYRREPLGMPDWATYINSGVMLLNLARWRAEELPTRLAEYIRRESPRLVFQDQCAINALLYADTRLVDLRWNMQARAISYARRPWSEDRYGLRVAARSPAVIHYSSSRKPWIYVSAMPNKHLYWRFLRRTAWRDAKPVGRRLSAFPEHVFNQLMCAAGGMSSWEDVARTPAAQTIWRGCRRLRAHAGRLRGRRAPGHASPLE